jgi:hypothetical protein
MHTIHTVIGVPKISRKVINTNEECFLIGPLPNGYGVTLGNSLRRVMLSSIPGTRVTGLKIAGVNHEYATLPGVHDSILDILLNLKYLVIEKKTTGVEWLTITKKKGGLVVKSVRTHWKKTIINRRFASPRHLAILQSGFGNFQGNPPIVLIRDTLIMQLPARVE